MIDAETLAGWKRQASDAIAVGGELMWLRPPTILALIAEVERLRAERDEALAESEHWKSHAEEAGAGFSRVCKDAARISARNVELAAEVERLKDRLAELADVATARAALGETGDES